MRDELNEIRKIENYLNGAMNASERHAFETMLNTDFSLKEEVELQKKVVDRIRFLAFKADVLSMQETLVTAQKVWWKKRLFLNSVLILAGVITTVFMINRFMHSSTPAELELESALHIKNSDPIAPANLVVSDSVPMVVSEPALYSDTKNKTAVKKQPHLAFQKPFEKFTLDASIGGTIITKDSKSAIHFDAGSLIDPE